MADTYRCNDCGHTAACGKGSPPSLCPDCGNNDLTLKPGKEPAPQPAAPAAPPETLERGE